MRAVRVRVTPDRGWFGPFHRATVEADAVSVRAVNELRLLADGSSVILYEYDGDRAVAESLADEYLAGDVDWQATELGGHQLMYANAEPSDLVTALVSLLDEWKVVVDWPIRVHDDRTLVLTLVGDEAEIGGALDAVPDDVDLRVQRTGEYRQGADRLLARLTPRERETLRAAVALGYYRNPREARYDDVAEAVDCAPGTVGQHLRNAEMKVMDALAGGGGGASADD